MPPDGPPVESPPSVPESWPTDTASDVAGLVSGSAAPAAHRPVDHSAPEVARVRRSFWARVAQRRSDRRGLLWGLAASLALGASLWWAMRPVPVPLPVPAATVAPAPVRPNSPPGRVAFRLRTPTVTVDHSVHSVFVMPGETVPLAVEGASAASLTASGGRLDKNTGSTGAAWTWTAPSTPGLVRLTVTNASTGETLRLHAFVLTPYDPAQRQIDGYAIGEYVQTSDPSRRIPRGFVAVPEGMSGVPVSPHFRLGDFICKQPGNPRYLALDERLLVKLETLLVRVQAAGIPATRFTVMSAYRTPAYNASIGNETDLSAHLYGQAADIFVDEDGDGQMDDVTGDGRVTRADAERLAEIAAPLDDDPGLVGGLGIYSPAPHRGPFIHIDVRGSRARW